MVPARPTQRKATRRRSFRSRTNRRRKHLRLVSPATRAKKNTTTSGAASTGVTTSAVSIVTRRTPLASSNVRVTTANAEKPGFGSIRMLKMNDPQLCLSCHSEVKPAFSSPFHHKVLEGAMRCSDCHNPHGGFELKQTRLATGGDAPCIKCHADKQGPFVYEHAPVKTEGCTACHTPHGSSNPRLLRYAAVNQLCLTCHSVAHDVGAVEPAGPQHNQNAQYANCTACHVKIHGSRSSPVFFR